MRRLFRILGWTFGVIAVLIGGCVAHANYRISQDETLAIDAIAPGRLLEVQGHRLHVQTLGDPQGDSTGAPLVMIHGFILSGHAAFLPWARDELAPHRSLVLPDLLGYGYSERITAPGDHYKPASYARDLAGILDQLGVQQADLAGHSWGGVIAAQFAHDYPQRVRRLVLVDAAFYFPKDSPLEGVIKLPLGIGRAATWHALGSGPMSFVHLVCGTQSTCEGEPPARIKDSTETLRAMIHTSRHSDGIDRIEAALPAITTPAVVVWGAKDQIAPLSNAERLARELPNARLVVVEDAWHMPWLEQPRETAQALLNAMPAQ